MKKINIVLLLIIFMMFIVPINVDAATETNRVKGYCTYGDFTFEFSYSNKSKYKFTTPYNMEINYDTAAKGKDMPVQTFRTIFSCGQNETAGNCKCPESVTIYTYTETNKNYYLANFNNSSLSNDDKAKYKNSIETYSLTSKKIEDTIPGSSSSSSSNSSSSNSSSPKCGIDSLSKIINNFSSTCGGNNTTGYEECKKTYVSDFNKEFNVQKTRCDNISACLEEVEKCQNAFDAAKVSTKEESNNFTNSTNSANQDYNNKNDKYELDNIYNGASLCSNESIALSVSVIGKVLDIIKIVVPIILIIMAIVDITKSIVSQDDSKMSKSTKTLVKRLISAVIVFFIVGIIQFVCGLVNNNSLDETCMGIISNPWQKIDASSETND